MPRWLPVLVLLAACAAPSPPLPPASPSARLLGAASLPVERRDYLFVDRSRPRDARVPGDGEPRTLPTAVWFPRGVGGRHPLVLYGHGYLSNGDSAAYLARDLAARGYVVVAPTHPLTKRWGLDTLADDVVHEPDDLRFVLDPVLAWTDAERPFDGEVDRERIGVMGTSLGGVTAVLLGYHPDLRDPRIKAVVSIAGPMAIFTPRLFATADVPFLMIAAGGDVVVDYGDNARRVLRDVPHGALLTIAGGTHVGFDAVAPVLPHLAGNPDALGCRVLSETLDLRDSGATLVGLDGMRGLIRLPKSPGPCRRAAPARWLDPEEQQTITTLAVAAFFTSCFGTDAERRAARAYLDEDLGRDFPTARWETAAPATRGGP